MSCNWRIRKLGDLVTFMSGGTPSKSNKDYWDGEIPWISASSMQSTRYSDSDLLVTEKGSHNGTRLVPKDTVLLLVRGSALHNKIPVGITTREVTFNQDVKALIPKTPEITPFYLLSWLISIKGFLLTKVENTGIGAGKLDTKILQDLDMPIPPNDELLRLESFCKALDEKIILNEAINQTLEQMVQALFKSWFVDFEPVKAKIAVLEAGGSQEEATLAAMTAISGKDADLLAFFEHEHPEQYAELKATAELFPSAMQDSDLGGIPDGWWNGCIGNIIARAKNRVGSTRATVFSAIAVGELVPSDEHFRKQVYSKSIEKYILVEPWDFAYNPSRVNIGSIGINDKNINGAVSPVYVVFKPIIDYRWFISIFTKTNYFKNNVSMLASGSVRQSLSYEELASISLCIPEVNIVNCFNNKYEKILKCIESNLHQNDTLNYIRDTLLPRLLSGEITLPEAEQSVSEAENV
ncbi:restriction endonuclease subunit S [Yersinia rochesterensis]|uniref:restriction endonuclease subunit S n=1 Tax=Yersinia rochesterensis TaxID=1604335 RepID=UPI002852FCC9|nr:restriction endonuclease subunit S [Yersinia rochesterensis]MDR5018297.1 restriction endonuclease subunit S [Yersinia rochesterensis]